MSTRDELGTEVGLGKRRQRTRGRKMGVTVHSAHPAPHSLPNMIWPPPPPPHFASRRLRDAPGPWMSTQFTENWNRDLQARLSQCFPQAEDEEAIDRCFEELKTALPTLGAADDWSLSLFGSAANGFGVRGSDLDVTCLSATQLPRRRRCSSDLSSLTKENKLENKIDMDIKEAAGLDSILSRTVSQDEDKLRKSSKLEQVDEALDSSTDDRSTEATRSPATSIGDQAVGSNHSEDSASRRGSKDEGEEEHREGREFATPQEILSQRWLPWLEKHPDFKVVEEVLFAKVPILKVKYAERLDIDMSVQNVKALQNTRLLRAYARLHPKVRELVIAVKLWAKSAEVCGASRCHLSSYSFTLLTIYFLQVGTIVRLPCLPVDAFDTDGLGEEDERVKAAAKSFDIRMSTAELLWDFFTFYTTYFFWGSEVVSPRLGTRQSIDSSVFAPLGGHWSPRLHIEDPFLLHRNLNCVLGIEQEATLRHALTAAMCRFTCGLLPIGLSPSDAQQSHTTGSRAHEASRAVTLNLADSMGACGKEAAGLADLTTTSSCDDANNSGGEVSSFSGAEEDEASEHQENGKGTPIKPVRRFAFTSEVTKSIAAQVSRACAEYVKPPPVQLQ